MADSLDRLIRLLRRLARIAREQQDLAVDLLTDLSIVRQTLAADATGRLDAAVEIGLLRAADARRRAEQRAAVTGVTKMEMRFNRHGAALVRIDGAEAFKLSRGDARLLRVLASFAAAEDGFPSWLTYEDLATELARKTGVAPTRRALVESVYRIRRGLKSVHHNPHLVRVDHKRGRLRFLLRSAPQDPAAHGRP